MPPSRRKATTAGAIIILVGAAVWLTGGSGAADRTRTGGADSPQGIAVPAYWSPTGAAADDFTHLVETAAPVALAVVNGPTSSAPVPFDPATAAQIERLHQEGVRVLGYVDTGYLGSTSMTTTRVNGGSVVAADWRDQAIHDATDWFNLYGGSGLGGIFLDQVTSACGAGDMYIDKYHEIADELRRIWPAISIVINPGTGTDECYVEVGDVMVLFENTYAEYRNWAPPAWVDRYPAARFWHLVHDTPTVAEMHDAVELSRQRRAGYVYVTNLTITATASPWASLPPRDYWTQLQLAVSPPPG